MTEPSNSSQAPIQPRIIIHGGAGNIRRENLPKESYEAYRASLLRVLSTASNLLFRPDSTSLNVATHIVSLLEDDPLFNCAKGAVFTSAGTVELEASVMVSSGFRKRGVGCMTVKHAKNPILLAKEMLIRGEKDDGGGAGLHCQLSGSELERLAATWGCEMVPQSYYFTQRRWDEHKRGLGKGKSAAERSQRKSSENLHNGGPSWDGHEYLPQGTVGAVVLDRFGTICAATSTGGLTNKIIGRIGDTPTLGAGFWAEEWIQDFTRSRQMLYQQPSPPSQVLSILDRASRGNLPSLIADCLSISASPLPVSPHSEKAKSTKHVVGMSGTGNGDSFLRISAVRTAAAISRFSTPSIPLSEAVEQIAGPNGELQRSAGDNWGRTGEGEGGIIGIELVGSEAKVVWDFNCGGMFRAWIDDHGKMQFMVFREEY